MRGGDPLHLACLEVYTHPQVMWTADDAADAQAHNRPERATCWQLAALAVVYYGIARVVL